MIHQEPAPRLSRPGLPALAFTLPIGVLTFPYGFVRAYMLNDQVGSEDHLRFLTPVALGAALATALTAALLSRDGGREHAVLTALAWCLGTTAAAAVVVMSMAS